MKTRSLDGVRVLVVEDNPLVAESLAEALICMEATVVSVLGNLDDGLGFVETRHDEIDIALLDVNLSGIMSYPIADMLERRRVPFVFMTGYDNPSVDVAYSGFPVCMKPFSFDSLMSAIWRRLDQTPPAE